MERGGDACIAQPGQRAPTRGDASIPTPLHTAPAPTRSDASEDAAHGDSYKTDLCKDPGGRTVRIAPRSRPLALPLSFASKVLVCHGEALADEARRFQLIDKGDSVIFDGDAALPFFVGHKLVSSRAIMTGALAWGDAVCGAEVCPIKVGGAVDGKRITKSQCTRAPCCREIGSIDKLQARCDLQAARAANDDEAADSGAGQSID